MLVDTEGLDLECERGVIDNEFIVAAVLLGLNDIVVRFLVLELNVSVADVLVLLFLLEEKCDDLSELGEVTLQSLGIQFFGNVLDEEVELLLFLQLVLVAVVGDQDFVTKNELVVKRSLGILRILRSTEVKSCVVLSFVL